MKRLIFGVTQKYKLHVCFKIWTECYCCGKNHAPGALKVQSCKFCNNKYTMPSAHIRHTVIFAFIAVLVFKSLNRKFLFVIRKGNRNCYKVDYFLRKQEVSQVTGKL